MEVKGRTPGIRPGMYVVECDRCGREIWSDEAHKTWEGLLVCFEDWEPRHPQEYVRGKPDRQRVPNPRPQPADIFQTPGLWWFTDIEQSGEILTIF